MRGIIKDAWFVSHLEWYEIVDGVGYVPTDKAPPEAVESMERLNQLEPEDIE